MIIFIVVLLIALVVCLVAYSSEKERANQASAELSKEMTKLQDEFERKNLQASQKVTKAEAELTMVKRKCDAYEKMHKDYDEVVKKTVELKGGIEGLKAELNSLEADLLIQTIDISDYENITSEECKNKLSMLKVKYNDIVKNDQAVNVANTNASKSVISNNRKQILLCFNAECVNIINNVNSKNVDTARGKIQRAFDSINKIFQVDGVSLAPELLEIKLEELTLVYGYAVKKEQEKEEQKAIREQMLEEEKVRREIEREKAKIEKEEAQFKGEISKLMGYLQKASDVEKQLYVDKIKELEDKLKSLEQDKENVLQREQNTRAGFVYVISNIGSFGENVYKIGMTRRLEPMDRVKELGSASVPFEFDVHAMIFSEDAPSLETTLHQTFKKYQVNKVNERKEFFRVPLDEIEEVVKQNHNATVTFTKIAEALQYRETLKIEGAE